MIRLSLGGCLLKSLTLIQKHHQAIQSNEVAKITESPAAVVGATKQQGVLSKASFEECSEIL